MTQTNKQQKMKAPIVAYMGYLFQTFFKRPFGYIIALLYVIYLAVILLIVPAAVHLEPLFIWTVGGFNMPIFNLFFIGGTAASIAVAVFRTGRDDGTDLNLSAKPLTKGITVGVKTIVYLLIMFIINGLTLAIVALILPIFGKFNQLTNLTGIVVSKYQGLILSVFIGNTVNMLFFGGISVFISMVGGQVITIIGTIATVFLLCLMNFLYPQVIQSATDILENKYDTEILSYSCNTMHQYLDADPNAKPLNFATIQCITDEQGVEENHFDTKEYWDKAESEAGRKAVNYIDIGKQLSSLYSVSGIDEAKLQEASKLVIGTNNSYDYIIDASTHVGSEENLEALNYPICVYDEVTSQGREFPKVIIVGGDMTLTSSNWYLLTTLWEINFDAITYMSSSPDGMSIPDWIWSRYPRPFNFMTDLYMTPAQIEASTELYWSAHNYALDHPEAMFRDVAYQEITNDESGAFFPVGGYNNLSGPEKQKIIEQNHLFWTILAHNEQTEAITNWAELHGYEDAVFPFASNIVTEWYRDQVQSIDPADSDFGLENRFILNVFKGSIDVEPMPDNPDEWSFSQLVTSEMSYSETFANMYQYTVKDFYNIATVVAIWTIISSVLFAGAIVVYKRTDFK